MRPEYVVKACAYCGHKTYARRQYITICRGEHSPHPHPARAMQPVIMARRSAAVDRKVVPDGR